MKRVYLYGIIVAAAATVVILLALHASSPLLYSAKDDAVTPFHTNNGVLTEISPENAASLLPLMGDLLDQHGSLTLNVRLEDYDIAARDLREFIGMGGHLDNLVINLDMSESEIEEWRRLNDDDLSILSELVNSTTALSELRSLEIRYRSEGNSAELYAVTIQGRALKQKLQQLYQDYKANEDPMVRISQKYDLNTTRYEESVADFAAIVDEFTAEQAAREQEFLPSGPDLTLAVIPDHGVYHDTLTMSGVLKGPSLLSQEVRIVIGGEDTRSVPVQPDGVFQYGYLIDRIRAGNHTAFAQSGAATFSTPVLFRVDELPTTLTLAPDQNGNRVTVTGTLVAGGHIPVTRAPVAIYLDEGGTGRTETIETGDDGHYSAVIALSPGTTRLRAVFSGEGYPLLPSESEEFTFHVSPGITGTDAGTGSFLVAALIIAAFIGAAVWYLRRRVWPAPASPPAEEYPATEQPAPIQEVPEAELYPGVPVPATREEVIASYRETVGEDAREAVRHLFLHLLALCQERIPLRNPRSLTPRELCRQSRGRSFFDAVRSFILRYEPVRYGGRVPDTERADAILARFSAASDAVEREEQA